MFDFYNSGVSGFLKLGGQVVMRRGTAAGGAFYSAKKWGAPLPPFTYAPELYICIKFCFFSKHFLTFESFIEEI